MTKGQNDGGGSSYCGRILYIEFILLCIQLRFTHLHLSKSERQMDEHYDVNDAGEWMNVMHNLKDHSKLTQNGSGVRLEEWTNARGMKNWHNKQLRNFLEVNTTKKLNIQIKLT